MPPKLEPAVQPLKTPGKWKTNLPDDPRAVASLGPVVLRGLMPAGKSKGETQKLYVLSLLFFNNKFLLL